MQLGVRDHTVNHQNVHVSCRLVSYLLNVKQLVCLETVHQINCLLRNELLGNK